MKRRVRTALALVAIGVALALTFAAYLDPHRVAELANRLWACF
jgi:hypothetical protein